jgi:hypothetical protein
MALARKFWVLDGPSVFDDDTAAASGAYGSSKGLDRVQGVSQILDGPFSLSEAVLT